MALKAQVICFIVYKGDASRCQPTDYPLLGIIETTTAVLEP
jgi:hypothetical protein